MQVIIEFDYVLILEWLGNRDQPTGQQLHEFLPTVGMRSELVVCHSWEDIQCALRNATASREEKGVPIVHLETHGDDPWSVDPENIAFGPEDDPGTAWHRLGELLAPLNVAAGFRLLVVSAACYGSAVMAAIDGGGHAAPFSCAVGFRTTVVEGRLRDAMRELYRSLRRGAPFAECVANAQRELNDGQEMRIENAVELAAKILQSAYLRRPDVARDMRLRQLRLQWETWFPPFLRDHNPAYRFENIDFGT